MVHAAEMAAPWKDYDLRRRCILALSSMARPFHDKWNKHNQALKWAYWLGSVHTVHPNAVHHHQTRINRQDTAIGCSGGDGLVQQPRSGCISRVSTSRRHHRQMKALARPDPAILRLGWARFWHMQPKPDLKDWMKIAPLYKVSPLALAVQTPLKSKMIHNQSNSFWWFCWVEVTYTFFLRP